MFISGGSGKVVLKPARCIKLSIRTAEAHSPGGMLQYPGAILSKHVKEAWVVSMFPRDFAGL
jgi:hypothetical protein